MQYVGVQSKELYLSVEWGLSPDCASSFSGRNSMHQSGILTNNQEYLVFLGLC